MARLLHSINVSITGSAHHEDVLADDEHHEYALQLLKSASGVLLGRNTFDLFASFWPLAAARQDLPPITRSFAAELDLKPKLVLSSTKVPTSWHNTLPVQGPALGALRDKVQELPGTIVLFGSPSLGASLATAGMLAELHILLQPFLVDSGPQAYAGLPDKRQLTLLEARRFKSGVVLLRYATEA
jgi:dihydrofolate reductase